MSGAEPERRGARGLGQSDWVGKSVLLAVVSAVSSLLLRSPGTGDVRVWELWRY